MPALGLWVCRLLAVYLLMGMGLEMKREGRHTPRVCDTRGGIHPEAKFFSTHGSVEPLSLCALKYKGGHL